MSKYALCMGINDYPRTSNDLHGCVNDARDWAAALEKRGFAVEMLLNKKATGAGMRAAIADVLSQADTGDVVVIQYSGHGSFVPDLNGDEPDGTDECICPYDSLPSGKVITDDDLFTLYTNRERGVRLIVISDSCNSGTVAKFAPIKTPPTTKGANAPQRRVRFLPPATFLSASKVRALGAKRPLRASSPPGRYAGLLFAACQDSEYSYDAYFRGRPNGAFTYVALQALKALPARATYGEWYRRIREVLPSQQYAQRPNLYGPSYMKGWQVFAEGRATKGRSVMR